MATSRAEQTIDSLGTPATASVPDDKAATAGHAFDYDALALAEQSAGIGVWSIDLTAGTVRATAQFFRIMGLPPTADPVPLETIRALRHPDDRERVVAGFRDALDGHADAYEMEYRIVRPDGNLRWIFGRGRVLRDTDGKPIRYSGIDLDITERKAAQAELAAAKEQLERMNQVLEERVRERTAQLESEAERRTEAEARLHQAQKMEAVGQLTGGIAHDFNNILQVIVGNLELSRITIERSTNIAVGDESRKRLLRAVETMQRASRSATQLVHRLLAFSRRQILEPAEIDVNALIDDMTEMIERTLGESIAVRTVQAPDLWPTFADRNHLESALLNLVVNARDAMPGGGTLLIETANAVIDTTYPADMAAGDYVMLSVSDNGCGIAKEHLEKVFEPFFTLKDTGKGSGLGLSMIYGFVRQSGGHVRLYSEPRVGTTVKMHLPRHVVHAGPGVTAGLAGVQRPTVPLARDGETILLVEDNDDVRTFAVAALESFGYRVVGVRDGATALELLDAGALPRLDLLFTDVVLPGRMSGVDLAPLASARRPRLGVLFASGYTRNAMSDAGMPGMNARLLDKPYSVENLATQCRRAIDEAGPGIPANRQDP
ncbi:MAG: ATP-binding protein [Betaproteobacteria bacterium]